MLQKGLQRDRRRIFLSLLILSIGLLTACGKNYHTKESTLFILKNGKVVCTDVRDYDEKKYNPDDYKKFAESAIETYNKEHGEDAVKLETVEHENGRLTTIIEYRFYEDFSKFNGMKLFVGSVAEALAAGYDFNVGFSSIKDGTAKNAKKDEITTSSEYNAVVLDTSYNVNVYGKIVYVSDGNVSIVDDRTVRFGEGNSLTTEAEEDTSAHGTEVDSGTEVTGTETDDSGLSSDDSVDTDDFDFTGEEDITFEFKDDLEENLSPEQESSPGELIIVFKK